MPDLTPEGQRIVEDVASRYAFSPDAVRAVLQAMVASGGGMAQFSHSELGGMGQWSRGGMIMIGDMFNNGLKSRVDALCRELSDVVGRTDVIARRPQSSQWQSQGGSGAWDVPANSLFVAQRPGGGDWWPSDLGWPSATGAQNDMRYACFPDTRRIAVEINGQVSVYDTGEYRVTGFSQQQSGDQSLTFTTAYGTVRLDSLTRISGPPKTVADSGDVFASIERLASLRDRGIISEDEFAAKKAELLGRL